MRKRHFLTFVVIAAIAVLPLNMAAAYTLYAQVYPPPGGQPGSGSEPDTRPGPGHLPGAYPSAGSNVVVGKQDLEQALTKASLSWSFSPTQPVENEPTRFTATLVYARPLGAGPKIDVAFANDADLTAVDPDQFDIQPVTDMRQDLDEGRPDGRGGLELDWSWDVTPHTFGSLALALAIEPVVVIDGVQSPDLYRRNKPIPINVVINPDHAALNRVVAAADKDFTLSVPETMQAEEPTTVTASFALGSASPDVTLRLDLSAVDGSVPLTIVEKPPGPYPPPNTVFAEWAVTPDRAGDVRFQVVAVVVTQSGNRSLEQSITRPITKVADAPSSFWGSAAGIITGVVSFLVTLIGGVASFAAIFPKPWKRLMVRLRLADPDPAPPPPPPPPSP